MATIENKPLHDWRDRLNLTQEGAADMLGISRAYYGQLERGQVFSRSIELAAAAIEHGVRLTVIGESHE